MDTTEQVVGNALSLSAGTKPLLAKTIVLTSEFGHIFLTGIRTWLESTDSINCKLGKSHDLEK